MKVQTISSGGKALEKKKTASERIATYVDNLYLQQSLNFRMQCLSLFQQVDSNGLEAPL